MDFFIGPISDIAEVADGYAAAADFHITDRFLMSTNAVNPILMMIIALIEFNITVGELDIFDFLRGKADLTAINIDTAFTADELDSK